MYAMYVLCSLNVTYNQERSTENAFPKLYSTFTKMNKGECRAQTYLLCGGVVIYFFVSLKVNDRDNLIWLLFILFSYFGSVVKMNVQSLPKKRRALRCYIWKVWPLRQKKASP